MEKVTLDTNCIINLLDTKSKSATSVEQLRESFRFALSSKVDIAITTGVESDLGKDKNDKRRKEMLSFLKMFPIIGAQDSIKDKKLLGEIQRIVFPGGLDKNSSSYSNKITDIHHLYVHIKSNRDFFVTDDRPILRKADELKTLGVITISPLGLLHYLERVETNKQAQFLPPEIVDSKYWNQKYRGKASFDYSNNNGVYTIGKGEYVFETKWSKASDTSIHAYNDMPSIESIALAKNTSAFDDIQVLESYNFSSRTRTPSRNDILILRNVNGKYALVKINDIQDDSRGNESDFLEFDYLIIISATTS